MMDGWYITYDPDRIPQYRLWHAEKKVSLMGPAGQFLTFGAVPIEPDASVRFDVASQFGEHKEAMALIRETFPKGEFTNDTGSAFRMTATEFAYVKLAAR